MSTISLIAGEQPVQEAAQHLVDHLLFGREMVVQTAGQDAGAVGDVAHGGGAQPALGEHRRGELQQLVAPAACLTGHSVHLIRVSTKRLLGQLNVMGAGSTPK